MNFQDHRKPSPYSPLPQFNTAYHPLEIPPPNSHSQFYLQRQPVRNNPARPAFNLKEYSFEMKEYFRPQQPVANAPLTFNLQSPNKLKAKKANRPSSKAGNRTAGNPFTRQLENEFFKNEPAQMPTHLEDFSKTTSTINGHSILNQLTVTEASEERIFTPLKPQETESSKIAHSNSLKILFERNESDAKNLGSNVFNYSSTVYLQRPAEPSTSSKSHAYLLDQKFLLDEVKSLKEMNESLQKEMKALKAKEEKELRSSRKENKFESRQLELQFEQNSKLLAQIEEMEKDLKGKVELNRYLEQQCSAYSEKHQNVQQQLDSFKKAQAEQSSKKDQFIAILQQQLIDFENESNLLKLTDRSRREEIAQLKKSLQLQSEKLQQQSTNNEIDKSEINILANRLENLQAKYEKLMHSHCETQIKLHNFQEELQQERTEWRQREERLLKEAHELEDKLNHAVEQKEDFYMQLASVKGQLIHSEQLKSFYQSQCAMKSQDLSETNKILRSKTQENDHLQLKVKAKELQIERLQSRLIEISQLVKQLEAQRHQKTGLEESLQLKSQEYELLWQRQKILQEDYKRISSQVQQKSNAITTQAAEIAQLKLTTEQMEAQYKEMSRRFDGLRTSFETQTLRCKQLQSSLTQNEFQYNILQREFSEHSLKNNDLQVELNRLQQLHQSLQSVHDEFTSKSQAEFEVLILKNAELSQSLNQKLLQNEELSQKLSRKYDQNLQNLKKICELQTRYTFVQSQYQQLVRQSLKQQQEKQYMLSSSIKSEVQPWEMLSKKEVEIEQLQTQIQLLESTLQQNAMRVAAREKQVGKAQLLKQEIASLMLIISQNEGRSQSQRQELLSKIQTRDKEIQNLKQTFQSQGIQYNSIISELKQSIARLEREDRVENMQTSIMQQSCEPHLKQWNSFNEFHSSQSIDSPSKMQKFQSAHQLQEAEKVSYMEMDRQGVAYLCDLLHIDMSSGNILSQIVVKVENVFNEVSLSRKSEESYRQVLDAFGIVDSSNSYGLLISEITAFKENLSLVIQQLKEEQAANQALRIELQGLQLVYEAELQKGQRLLLQLHSLGELNQDLNQSVLGLTARLCNQKLKMLQAMGLARAGLSETSIRSGEFVTARSIGEE